MDYLLDYSFAKDSQGNIIFFRWGYYFSYYILPNAKKKSEIRSFLELYYLITIVGAISIGGILGVQYSLLIIPISFAWYYFETARLLKGLKKHKPSIFL